MKKGAVIGDGREGPQGAGMYDIGGRSPCSLPQPGALFAHLDSLRDHGPVLGAQVLGPESQTFGF